MMKSAVAFLGLVVPLSLGFGATAAYGNEGPISIAITRGNQPVFNDSVSDGVPPPEVFVDGQPVMPAP